MSKRLPLGLAGAGGPRPDGFPADPFFGHALAGAALPNGRRIHGVPVQHWSGGSLLPNDRNRSLWQGYVIETAAGPVYFAGATGYADHFEWAHERFGDMRLALLPIGAYEPRWFLAYQHMNPAEAVQAHLELRAQTKPGDSLGHLQADRRRADASTAGSDRGASGTRPE
ncbi:MBL fold metallo-hydrolase [Algiphilus sp. W345]|uniref:MBL fold metallo-hydrolase n=1 Tax=Banduia mediterranea TaxID=3075609 RepID=A0ABU2WJQ0_9GAMM|nr:MBL fold metallo-hydrolase [Algiphilus sp. W345]MDT0497469.1 MBL fold metallo-hydrolase [Algiphilus sp. W345]